MVIVLISRFSDSIIRMVSMISLESIIVDPNPRLMMDLYFPNSPSHRYPSDLVHRLEDFFPLDLDLNTYGFSFLGQFVTQI